MKKHGKKFTAAQAQVAAERTYTIEDAIPLVQKVKFAKFDETVEISLRLGARSMTRDRLPAERPSGKDIKELRAYVLGEIDGAFGDLVPKLAEYQVVGCSKVLRQLARLAGDRPGKARELRLDDLQAWIPRLAKLPPSRRAELPGISRVRAHQALAGAIVAESLLQVTGGRVVICPWSTRDGLLLTLADHAGTPRAQRFRAA